LSNAHKKLEIQSSKLQTLKGESVREGYTVRTSSHEVQLKLLVSPDLKLVRVLVEEKMGTLLSSFA
jgi:hypothetical protein